MRTESTTESRFPVNRLGLHQLIQRFDAKPLTMRDIMKPVLAQMLGIRPPRMYGGERLIGF